MKQDFVLYPEALAMKELDFEESCFGGYEQEGKEFKYYTPNTTLKELQKINHFEHKSHTNSMVCVGTQCTSPTYQQAFRWFREKHNLYHSINPLGHNMNSCMVGELGKLLSIGNEYNYEEAELECLRELIKIVKSK